MHPGCTCTGLTSTKIHAATSDAAAAVDDGGRGERRLGAARAGAGRAGRRRAASLHFFATIVRDVVWQVHMECRVQINITIFNEHAAASAASMPGNVRKNVGYERVGTGRAAKTKGVAAEQVLGAGVVGLLSGHHGVGAARRGRAGGPRRGAHWRRMPRLTSALDLSAYAGVPYVLVHAA